MFNVKNCRTGKLVKDAITRKPRIFLNEEDANRCVSSQEYYSVTNASAFNSIRPSKYIVVPCKINS